MHAAKAICIPASSSSAFLRRVAPAQICKTAPMDDLTDRQRRWLRALMARTGLTATELARRAAVAPSTLLRPLNDPSHKFALSARTIAKIEQAARGLGADVGFAEQGLADFPAAPATLTDDDYATLHAAVVAEMQASGLPTRPTDTAVIVRQADALALAKPRSMPLADRIILAAQEAVHDADRRWSAAIRRTR